MQWLRGLWLTSTTLAMREIVRFLRQRTRLVGALGQPIIFWVLFGAGLRGSFQTAQGQSFQEYFFPGVAVMIVLFTAIFSTISIIEDRREGFLQGVLAAPVPRTGIVLGKLFGGMILAVSQAMLFLLIGPLLSLVGLSPELHTGLTWHNVLPVLGFTALLSLALTALGYLMAWPLDSTQGFHALMSVFLMPMWLLSGSFFPANSGWLGVVVACNPLTYGVAGLRRLLSPTVSPDLPGWTLSIGVTTLFAVICMTVAVWQTTRRSSLNVR